MTQKFKPCSFLTMFILAAVIATSGIAICADTVQPGNTTNDSFNKSKKLLHSAVYKDTTSRLDIYCGCKYDVESTTSHPNREVKLRTASIVLWWGTTREVPVL